MFNITPEFLITSLVVVLIPGTGVIYTVSTALFRGKRSGIAAAAGCTAGIVPHLAATILGLSAILHMSSLAFQAVKFAGSAYLLYLAWSMWNETGSINFKSNTERKGLTKIALRGFLINILNPKLSLFFLAFLPQFISAGSLSPTYEICVLSLIFMAMTFVVFILYTIAADSVSSFITESQRGVIRLQRSFSLIFAILGIKLAMTER